MNSEIKIIISFLFKRSGKEELTASELYLPLSMDLKWFSPKEAKDFVNSALLQNFLIKKGDRIKPNFDCKKIAVPVGFYPSKQIFEEETDMVNEERQDVVKLIIGQIVEKTEQDEQGVFEEIKEVSNEKNISLEVAALLVSREYDIVISIFLDQVEDKIFIENAE
ncbi:MAG: DUF2240 family protein [Thermoplasmatales archaeon]|jgi:hypothetical protein|nr:DUF2240 family protein [Thermoplasmatales archaeon]MCK5258942.1 DUF2240 family protein [Thermoplasmatales archaeon]